LTRWFISWFMRWLINEVLIDKLRDGDLLIIYYNQLYEPQPFRLNPPKVGSKALQDVIPTRKSAKSTDSRVHILVALEVAPGTYPDEIMRFRRVNPPTEHTPQMNIL